MIVIHPKDTTTDFLKPLYQSESQVELYTQSHSNAEIRRALSRKAYPGETVMMLGHGCERGLLADSSDNKKFDRLIVNSSHVQFLRRQPCIGIWCNADKFASWYRLHGLFTGMIISEVYEAYMYGIRATAEEVETENVRLVDLALRALRETGSLAEVPDYIRTHAPMDTPLQRFNYNNFHYFP